MRCLGVVQKVTALQERATTGPVEEARRSELNSKRALVLAKLNSSDDRSFAIHKMKPIIDHGRVGGGVVSIRMRRNNEMMNSHSGAKDGCGG